MDNDTKSSARKNVMAGTLVVSLCLNFILIGFLQAGRSGSEEVHVSEVASPVLELTESELEDRLRKLNEQIKEAQFELEKAQAGTALFPGEKPQFQGSTFVNNARIIELAGQKKLVEDKLAGLHK